MVLFMAGGHETRVQFPAARSAVEGEADNLRCLRSPRNYDMGLILYSKLGCPWCREVLAFLKEKKVPFEEREVRGNLEYLNELVKKSGQQKTPTLDLDGEILADADRESVERFLREEKVIGT